MMKKQPSYIEKLPEDLAEDPFWKTDLVARPTTFGASNRKLSSRDVKIDHPTRLQTEISDWEMRDMFKVHHGRLQIESQWGRYQSPPPGEYNPNHEKLSYRELFPSIKIANKNVDDYFDEVDYARTHPLTPSYNNKKKEYKSNLLKKSHRINFSDLTQYMQKKSPHHKHLKTQNNSSNLQNINLEDLKESLLPGPGQYPTASKMELTLRYERVPLPVLRPKENRGKPRAILDFETVEIIQNRNRFNNGKIIIIIILINQL
jgi:hypothetical protein